jgi:hypothetical protein
MMFNEKMMYTLSSNFSEGRRRVCVRVCGYYLTNIIEVSSMVLVVVDEDYVK